MKCADATVGRLRCERYDSADSRNAGGIQLRSDRTSHKTDAPKDPPTIVQACGHGALAFFDGAIPFANPFASHGQYDDICKCCDSIGGHTEFGFGRG